MGGKPKNHREAMDVIIDSNDRDKNSYPNPADYVIKLPFTIRGVKYIELMSMQLTRTESAVNSGNNTFTYTTEGSSYLITLPVGDYQSNEQDCIVRLVKKALRTIRSTIEVARTDTYKLQITDTVPFTLQIPEGTANLLGISQGITSAELDATTNLYKVTGNKIISTQGIPYLILYVNDYTRIVSPTNQLNRAYMLIPLESKRYMDRFVINNDEKEKKGRYKLMDQQRTLHQFRIRFTRPDGSLYDFNGVDHHIMFKLSS
jgi:hypothetical protein